MVLWRPKTPKRCPFHHRGLEGKSRKSRDTWSNRKVWPCSAKWSRANANRNLQREHTGHSKHSLPTTQEITLHPCVHGVSIHYQMVNTEISFIIFFVGEDGEALYSQQKQYLSWLWLRSVQFSSVAQSCLTFCDPMDCSTPGLPVHHQLLKFTQTHVHWVGDVIQPSHPLSSPSTPAFNHSHDQGLFKESALCIRWPKYWSFSFNISPSNEYSGLISFRMDWLDLLAV